jgi:hypothetical protein
MRRAPMLVDVCSSLPLKLCSTAVLIDVILLAIPHCASYYIFEATNSGTPKLPFWFCYEVSVPLNPTDFREEIQANFAHAYK